MKIAPSLPLCLAWVFLIGALASDPIAAAQPNLLVIHTDEHHPKTLGCYGGRIVRTPHIDSLARQGAMCTSFYATTPVCSPSRAALVSGRYPQNTPVVTNNIPLGDDVVTFAEVLRRKGYATGYAGKWHLDGNGKPQWAPKRKFGFEDNRYMFNRGHWKKFIDTPKGPAVGAKDKKGKPGYGLAGADDKTFATDWLTDKAIDFLNTNKREGGGKPFCYMLSYPDPHGPNTVRAPYDTMYNRVRVPIPPSLFKNPSQVPAWAAKAGVTPKQLEKLMPPYYGMVKCIDDNVGRILEALKANGQLDNTVIVFTSDHGDLCGEHCRHNKGVPYEGSARVAFLMRYPRKIKAGTVIGEALTMTDFMPTVLSLMGQGKGLNKLGVEGRDATQLFSPSENVDASAEWDDVAFLRGTNDWLCVVTDDLKLVYSQKTTPWLFDLSKDKDELNNVFGKAAYAAQVKAMTRKLVAYGKKHKDTRIDEPAIQAAIQKVLGE